MNVKIILKIVGHADISASMSAYNEATREKEMGSFGNQKGKIWINRREKVYLLFYLQLWVKAKKYENKWELPWRKP